MKNKTKVVLGLAAMLAGTAGIAGVSTFAWFTTQSTAAISFQKAHVVSDSETIVVTYVANSGAACGIDDKNVASTGTKANPTGFNITEAAINVRDISGYNNTFFRPTWTETGTKATKISSVTNSAANSFWIQFQMQITNKGTHKTNVYLDHDSSVSAATGATDATASSLAAQATRISLYDNSPKTAEGADAPVLRTIWQADDTDGAGNYHTLKSNTTNTGKAYTLTNTICDDVNPASDTDLKDAFHSGSWPTVGGTFTPAVGQLVTTLDSGKSAIINVNAWLEGTVAAATNACIGGDVYWSLALQAVNAA